MTSIALFSLSSVRILIKEFQFFFLTFARKVKVSFVILREYNDLCHNIKYVATLFVSNNTIFA